MRVLFFSNHFANPGGHGLAMYARRLHAALCELPGVEPVPVATHSRLPRSELDTLRAASGLRLCPWGRRLTPLAWTTVGAPAVERWAGRKVDVVHATWMGFPVATRRPMVVTVHDLGPLTHPQYFSKTPAWLLKRALRQTVSRAAAVICVSRATADELIAYTMKELGCDITERVRVVHEGVGPEWFYPVDEPGSEAIDGVPDMPFVLMSGKVSPRKNNTAVVRAMAKLADRIPHHLVIVGGMGWDTDELTHHLSAAPPTGRVHLLGYVTERQLRGLYQRAAAYVYPSLFEGFGLPVLEAMAAGCPVVTSDRSSLPEVAGDAALCVDPTRDDAIAQGIEAVCTDTALASDLAQRGRRRASGFGWKKCAEQTAEVYAEACADIDCMAAPA